MMIRRREQSRSPRPQRTVDIDDQQPSIRLRTFRRMNSNNVLNSTSTSSTTTPAATATTTATTTSTLHNNGNSNSTSTSNSNIKNNPQTTATPSPPKQPRYLTTEEIIDLCKRLVEGERVHDSDLVEDVRPKLTINMGTSHIAHVPDAVIDIIRDEVARLSLSHNSIDRIPPRISECVHLRYINIRANKFTQFPQEVIHKIKKALPCPLSSSTFPPFIAAGFDFRFLSPNCLTNSRHANFQVFSLPYLEILDLSRNRITEIPERISQLTSLRVLSIMQNMISDLPDELSGMTQLQVLKLTGNPLKPALKKILERRGEKNATPAELADREPSLTFEIKKFLKGRQQQQSMNNAVSTDNGNFSENTAAAEPPRIAKRGSRFPVVPSRQGSDNSYDGRQVSISNRPPPIPTRSHYRLASGHNTHHGANSLTVHNYDNDQNGSGERNRSKSEGRIDSNSSPEKQRRVPFPRKNTVLGTLDEMRPYRESHLRLNSGSDGAEAQESGSSSPVSFNRADGCRHTNITRGVPSTIHRRKGPGATHPIIEGSKSLLYSLLQIYPHLSSLINVLFEEDHRRSRLEIMLYNAASHLDQLDDTLHRLEFSSSPSSLSSSSADWTYGNISNAGIEALRRESETCLMTFMHIGNQLQMNTNRAVAICDPRYIRSLLLTIYGSLTELRNAHKAFEAIEDGVGYEHGASVGGQGQQQQQMLLQQQTKSEMLLHRDTVKVPGKRSEDIIVSSPIATTTIATALPVRGPFGGSGNTSQPTSRRMRSETTIQHVQQRPSTARSQSRPPPVPSLRSTTLTPTLNGRSRSTSRSQVVVNTSGPSSLLNTPRSGEPSPQVPEPLGTSPLPVNPLTGMDESEEERFFEKIFVQLSAACDTTLHAVPVIHRLFTHSLSSAEEARSPPELRALWSKMILRCRHCIEVSEKLKERLTNTRVREPAGDLRSQKEFWQLCTVFLHAFIELASDMREAKNLRLFSPDVAAILRPVQRASREAGRLIESSPWAHMAALNKSSLSSIATPVSASAGGTSTPNHSVSIPIPTPNSANVSTGGTGSSFGRSPHPAVLTAAPRQQQQQQQQQQHHGGSTSNAHSPSHTASNMTPLSKIASRPPTPLSSGFGVMLPGSRPPIPTPPQTTAHFFDRPLPPDPPTTAQQQQQQQQQQPLTTFSLMRR
ncbi:RAM signaling pathway, SOG2 [Ascosphaera apis ARSEF 7405]|uniref:RAM signaling pathway, SOG2 n=1 Tax=Ascosphaera apis ARSEF 7405 TaxID=392613 RepID=A0A167ZK99_9EURO|nr:RAM signaling pathway, SOG2 [Ascosphaera apis ARSEF 7405]